MAKTKAERLFTLSWNNANYPNLSIGERYRTRECRGVLWSNGLISLSIGTVWESRHEMETNLKASGKYTLHFDDEAKTDEIAAVEEQRL